MIFLVGLTFGADALTMRISIPLGVLTDFLRLTVATGAEFMKLLFGDCLIRFAFDVKLPGPFKLS